MSVRVCVSVCVCVCMYVCVYFYKKNVKMESKQGNENYKEWRISSLLGQVSYNIRINMHQIRQTPEPENKFRQTQNH